jgi:hypothetical protein
VHLLASATVNLPFHHPYQVIQTYYFQSQKLVLAAWETANAQCHSWPQLQLSSHSYYSWATQAQVRIIYRVSLCLAVQPHWLHLRKRFLLKQEICYVLNQPHRLSEPQMVCLKITHVVAEIGSKMTQHLASHVHYYPMQMPLRYLFFFIARWFQCFINE